MTMSSDDLFIEWVPAMSVKVECIDEDHKKRIVGHIIGTDACYIDAMRGKEELITETSDAFEQQAN